jgi:POT family proton-dependent oligopeptide transporter
MGLSFVSKVAPPKMKGLMMGGWFGATAVGNYLAGFVGRFYQHWELWQFFLLLFFTSLFAALLLRLTLKRLKKATE